MILFWSNDPSILLNKDAILELWPTPKMEYEQKLNAITRLIVLLTLLGFLFTMSFKILLTGIVTVAVIYGLYTMKDKDGKQKVTKEMFQNQSRDNRDNEREKEEKGREGQQSQSQGKENMRGDGAMVSKNLQNPETLEVFLKSDFEKNSKKNPFANVLLTDIGDNPNRKAAPPSFNPDVYEDITQSVKKMVQNLNPEIKNTNKQLFGDLGENFYLDQSNRNFFSTANTRITNDQGAYSQFLYGGMISGKESGIDGAIARVQDNYRYTLY